MMAHSSKTRIFGKVDGQFIAAGIFLPACAKCW